jgi:hypothetical protein
LTSFFRELTFAVHGVDGAGEGGPAGPKKPRLQVIHTLELDPKNSPLERLLPDPELREHHAAALQKISARHEFAKVFESGTFSKLISNTT